MGKEELYDEFMRLFPSSRLENLKLERELAELEAELENVAQKGVKHEYRNQKCSIKTN